jgi:hypothetical protein
MTPCTIKGMREPTGRWLDEDESISTDGMCDGRTIFLVEHLIEHFNLKRDGRVFATLPVYEDQDGDEFVFADEFAELCAAIGAPLGSPIVESGS